MFKSYKTREIYSVFPLLIAQSYSIEKHILRRLEREECKKLLQQKI